MVLLQIYKGTFSEKKQPLAGPTWLYQGSGPPRQQSVLPKQGQTSNIGQNVAGKILSAKNL